MEAAAEKMRLEPRRFLGRFALSTQLAIWPNARAAGTGPVSACDIRRVLAVVPSPSAGMRAHLFSAYTAAAAAGWRFTFVGPADGALADLRDCLRSVPRTEYIGVAVKRRNCRMWPAVRSLLRDGGFDLVHSHGPTAAVQAAIGGFGLGAPHVVTLHEPLHPEWARGLLGRLRRWLLGRADAIVVASEDARADLIAKAPALARRPERIAIVPNGVDIRRSAYSREGDGFLRSELGVGLDTALVGYFGPLTPASDFPVLLDAVQLLADAAPPFHVAAFGEPSDNRRDRVEQRRLCDQVTLLGAPEDIYPLLRQLDLVVAPAATLEAVQAAMAAMAAGVPVLGTDGPGMRELLRGTPSRSVGAGDADALRHGINLALSRPWTEAARAFAPAARRRFDGAQSVDRLLALFDRATARTSGAVRPASEAAHARLAA
jgi:glycosyltransferase involved in cell wall biosynthesis